MPPSPKPDAGQQHQFVAVMCINCGIWFGLPRDAQATWSVFGKVFFCPNGHELRYAPSVEEDEIADLKSSLESREETIKDLRAAIASLKGDAVDARYKAEQAEAALAAAVEQRPPLQHLVKLDHRGNFACPHCPKTLATWARFARHMVSVHGDSSLSDRYREGVRLVAVDDRQPRLPLCAIAATEERDGGRP
jgi:hypothetical protein